MTNNLKVFRQNILWHLGNSRALFSTSQKPLFDKILVANRGEIACRVFRTANKLGIKSVAVFSEVDGQSIHAQMADESYHIGPAASQDSYLSIQKIIDVTKISGAQAVHPGYGFLSENFRFAEELTKSGIKFIGPSSQAMKDMGSKSASKEIMIKAGVPVVPGYHGENQDPAKLKDLASEIGYPIMIKAVLGGGGKGMRIVKTPEEFYDMLESSKREAMKSFSDSRVLLERYIERPRHIEVQIFGDDFGNVVHLHERDCSAQRRHQKILEEAPAPGLEENLRRELGELAIKAAKAVNYVGAGTVEFIFDTDTNKFYFMEMNTRLQVEHPVTEMITGLDLVHWQLQVASGNSLPLKQNEIKRSGHAIEARIYAENPENNFMPDTGRLEYLSYPPNEENVRIETGIRQGDEISVYYDPMIAKVITRGNNRIGALRKLDQILSQFNVVGVKTNISLIRRILQHEAFQIGAIDTSFIKKYENVLLSPPSNSNSEIASAAVLGIIKDSPAHNNTSAWESEQDFSPFIMRKSSIRLGFLSDVYNCSITFLHNDTYEVKIKNEKTNLESSITLGMQVRKDKVTITSGPKRIFDINYHVGNSGICTIFYPEETKNFQFISYVPDLVDHQESQNSVLSPMPCRVSQIKVKSGAKVKQGEVLAVVEAMKMEHMIKAPRDGTVMRIWHQEGDLVKEKAKILDIE